MDDDRTRVLRQKDSAAFAFLVGLAGVRPKDIFVVDKAVFQMGQGTANELTISHHFGSIQENHARIFFENQIAAFVLQNLSDNQSTYLNGQPIERETLKDNDHIQLGDELELIFKQAW